MSKDLQFALASLRGALAGAQILDNLRVSVSASDLKTILEAYDHSRDEVAGVKAELTEVRNTLGKLSRGDGDL